MMDRNFFDGSAITAGIVIFWDWFMGNLGLLQNTVGLLVGLATLIYTVIRIVQALKGKK